MKNEKNRVEKIKLLRDLASGKITLDKAFPPGLEIWYENEAGMFKDHKTGNGFTLEELLSRNTRKHVLIFIRQAGNEPIVDDNP